MKGQQLSIGGEGYERMQLRDQIRHRPDTYTGAPAGLTSEKLWLAKLDEQQNIILNLEKGITSLCMLGVLKEIFDNATDNVTRSIGQNIAPGPIEIIVTNRILVVKNYGLHIPIEMHKTEGIPVPQMLFGVLLTSDNYNDSIKRYKVGRNGYGVKLANIFSYSFRVVIVDPVRKLKYTQVWNNGMKECLSPVIVHCEEPASTEITIMPDFNFFYSDPQAPNDWTPCMNGYFLNKCIEMSWSAGIITTFNGSRLDYIDTNRFFWSHFPPRKPEEEPPRTIKWHSKDGLQEFMVADTPDTGFVCAFVNKTPVHMGKHVNGYIRAIFADLIDRFKQKGKKVTVVQLKPHISIILKVTLENPEFDSQIKKGLTNPEVRVSLPSRISKAVLGWDVNERLKKHFGMKTKKQVQNTKRKIAVRKVKDAIMAGVPGEAHKCTLILTEGESAASLAIKGLKYLHGGVNYNGVFPLGGKLMNVKRYSTERQLANRELGAVMQLLGAERGVDYTVPENYAKLRYGRIMIMCDQDDDGHHISGLIMCFIFTTLKTLAPFDFTLALLTPIVQATKRQNQVSFYTHAKFLKWQASLETLKGWDIKYYKGLGSWDDDDYILQKLFERPTILLYKPNHMTKSVIELAFDKKNADLRKKWLSAYRFNPDHQLTTPRCVTDFFDTEFRQYSLASVRRAIPSIFGLKPSQLKVLWTIFKKPKGMKLTKIPQFGGAVMEKAGYHHGETALYGAIKGMGMNYVTGPNNLPLLLTQGNFGTRRLRGRDSAAARYIYVKGNWKLLDVLFPEADRPLWPKQLDDGEEIEPKYMTGVIPLLFNINKGIATGWSTDIPPFDPRVICEFVRQCVVEIKVKRQQGQHINQIEIDIASKPELVPWYKRYNGEMRRIKNKPFEKYINFGKFDLVVMQNIHGGNEKLVRITELPAGKAIKPYGEWLKKEEEKFQDGKEDVILRSVEDHGIPPKVDFRVFGMNNPTYDRLKLAKSISLSNLVLIDEKGIPKKFQYVYEIVCYFCRLRLDLYEKRRLHIIGELKTELAFTNLKYMFVCDIVYERLIIRNRKKSEYTPYMKEKGYPYEGKESFLKMPLNSLTHEKMAKLKKQIGDIEAQLKYYSEVLPEDLWLDDLEKLTKVVHEMINKELSRDT